VRGKCSPYEAVDLDLELDPKTKWHLPLPFKPTRDEYNQFECHCYCNEKSMACFIQDPYTELKEPFLYNPCAKNNYLSMRRLAAVNNKPDPKILRQFKHYVDGILKTEIYPMIDQYFQYDVNQWFNHLNAAKQDQVAQFIPGSDRYIPYSLPEEIDTNYENFVKTEKQLGSINEWPKTRAICSPTSALKYLMGPPVLALEKLFKKKFLGYRVPLTWDEQEKELMNDYMEGFTQQLSGDASGYDNSRTIELKRIVDFPIYRYLQEKGMITHVSKQQWEAVFKEYRKVKMVVRINKRMVNLGSMSILGRTFSGSPDTTFMNTITMALVIRFIHEHLLKMNPLEYKPWTKGDDFAVRYQIGADLEKIKKAYYQVFALKTKGYQQGETHGLGLTAKFLQQGGIENMEFCSQEFFWNRGAIKIVRIIERVIDNDPWSRKLAQGGINTQVCFAIMEAAQKWSRGNNIFTAIYTKIIESTKQRIVKNKIGKSKERLPLLLDNQNYSDRIGGYWEQQQLIERISEQTIDPYDYENHINQKYGLSYVDIINKLALDWNTAYEVIYGEDEEKKDDSVLR
jgi:hypothetical protein